MTAAYKTYREADIGTADRGKLILMVYDHCITWVRKAEEDLQAKNFESMSKAIQRAQRGLNELMSTLNMEKGGEVARNLFRLYDFYARHLTRAMRERSALALRDVAAMMTRLREAWAEAIEKMRREARGALAAGSLSLVS
jgi:flagellar protein FliS